MSRQRLLFIIGVLVGVLCLWLAMRDTDFASIAAALSQAAWWWALPFLLALFGFYAIKAVRWHLLLSPLARIPSSRLFAPIMIGYAGSTLLPMQLGEFLRTYVCARQHDLRVSAVLASIVLERVFDLVTILLILAASILFGPHVTDGLMQAGYILASVALAGLVTTVYIIAFTEQFMRLCAWTLKLLPPRLREVALEQISTAATGLSAMRDMKLLAGIFATSLLQWCFMWICVHTSLIAMSIDVPASATFVVMAFTVVALTLPTSPGFIGSVQLAYTLALEIYAVAPADAFAASVFFHALAYASVVVVGFTFLYRLGYTFSGARRAVAKQSEQADDTQTETSSLTRPDRA